MGAMGAEKSTFSQLLVLRKELSAIQGSSLDTLFQLIDTFADGWARRRAICALLEAAIPPDPNQAIELIERLGRESDRRWCLGILARSGKLRGAALTRALDLVDSAFSKKRLQILAG